MKKLKRWIINTTGSLEGLVMDNILGVKTQPRTFGYHDRIYPSDVSGNNDPTPLQVKMYYMLWSALSGIDFKPTDVVYDIGCGTGRILCFIARFHKVQRCVGVELDYAFACKAKLNAKRLRNGKCAVSVHCNDVVRHTSYDDGTIFVLFNPFGQKTLGAFLERLENSLQRNPRDIRIVYINPEAKEVFENRGWERTKELSIKGSPLYVEYYTPPAMALRQPAHAF